MKRDRGEARAGADPTAIGIGLAFAGMLVLTLTPVAGRWTDIPPGFAVMALGVAMILIVGGAVIGLLAGREGSSGDSDPDGTQPPDRDR